MTPDQQRIAIAGARGYTFHGEATYGGTELNGWWKGQEYARSGLPQWLDSLDAAITLCDALAKDGWFCQLSNGLDTTWECEFYRKPTDETHPDNIGFFQGANWELHYAASNTAAEAICQCFLRTLNLWTAQPSDA